MIKSCHNEDELAYIRGILQTLDLKGSCAEIGVYHGGSAKVIKEERPNEDVYLFDTFGGIMSEHAEENWPNGDYACSEKDVRRNIGDNYIYIKGNVCETKSQVEDLKFAFIHFDLDVPIPLENSLPFFYNRLKKGGAMLISNYDDSHIGGKKAIDDFIKDKDYKRHSRYVYLRR